MASGHTAIIWRGEPVSEPRFPPLVPQGWVLLRVDYARWCPIDDAVTAGLLPIESGTVMGCSGTGTVLELGVDANTSLAGRRAALIRIDEDYAPPLQGDGFLSRYVAVPTTHIAEIDEIDPVSTFLLDASLACSTARRLDYADHVLVIGCGSFGLFTSIILADNGYNVVVHTSGPDTQRLAKRLGLETADRVDNRRYDAIVAASLNVHKVEQALSTSRPSMVVLHPVYAFYGWPACRKCWSLETFIPMGGEAGCARKLLERLRQIVEENIAIVEGLSPPPGIGGPILGYVFRL